MGRVSGLQGRGGGGQVAAMFVVLAARRFGTTSCRVTAGDAGIIVAADYPLPNAAERAAYHAVRAAGPPPVSAA